MSFGLQTECLHQLRRLHHHPMLLLLETLPPHLADSTLVVVSTIRLDTFRNPNFPPVHLTPSSLLFMRRDKKTKEEPDKPRILPQMTTRKLFSTPRLYQPHLEPFALVN